MKQSTINFNNARMQLIDKLSEENSINIQTLRYLIFWNYQLLDFFYTNDSELNPLENEISLDADLDISDEDLLEEFINSTASIIDYIEDPSLLVSDELVNKVTDFYRGYL
mgnify:CR=1 FL=1